MGSVLPADEVLLESTITGAIVNTFKSVPLVAQMVKVYPVERFFDSRNSDIQDSTVLDPESQALSLTSIIQVGMPIVSEEEYAGGCATQLTFVYPITFDLSVKDKWTKAGFAYTSSSALFKAIYMKSRKAFKLNRTLGYDNCIHSFLQQENVEIVEDAETGSMLHSADWSLEVQCTGILV